MAKKPGASPSAMKNRAAKTAAALGTAQGGSVAAAAPAAPRRKTTPLQFLREVDAERKKVTWTTRKETWITSVMVLIMVVITAVFFLVVDWVLGTGMAQILKIATGA